MDEQQTSFLVNMVAILGMIGIFYFFVMRPQKKADKQKEYMRSSLKKGDKVITIGGIYGVVSSLSENKIGLRVAEKVDIEVARVAIARFQDDTKQELMNAEADGKK